MSPNTSLLFFMKIRKHTKKIKAIPENLSYKLIFIVEYYYNISGKCK